MEDAVELEKYLPISYKTPAEQDYIVFIWDAFETNYQDGKYQFAFLAYHMLVMSFIYFTIWKIRENEPDDFKKATIGSSKDTENILIQASSPFVFGKINERSILRFLKLIQCDNSKIGTYAKLVDDRNEIAHANGNIFYNNQTSLDKKISGILSIVNEIQTHSNSIINHCYENFLVENHNESEREYADLNDQIREVLIHGYYLSQKDIDFCIGFDIEELRGQIGFNQIKILHSSLCEAYGTEEDKMW